MFKKKRKEITPVELTIPEGYVFTYTVSEITGYRVGLKWTLTYQGKQADFGAYNIKSNEPNLEDKMWYFGYRKASRSNSQRIIEESAGLAVGTEIVLPATRVLADEPSHWYWREAGYYDA